jgi:hypothetical protein
VDWIRRALGKRPHRAVEGAYAQHFFTFRGVVRRFRDHGFELIAAQNSDCLLPLVRSLPDGRLAELDCALADRVPAAVASGWYFAFRSAARAASGARPRAQEEPSVTATVTTKTSHSARRTPCNAF